MQIPKRKPGKYTFDQPDLTVTEAKLNELNAELERLKIAHPKQAAEVRRLAEMGDLSENAGYQIAKGKLRGMNERILELEDRVRRAVIIKAGAGSDIVGLGRNVTVEVGGKQMTFVILGSAETDPNAGIISRHSPIGAALLGRRVGESVAVKLPGREVEYKIIKIE